MKLFLLLVAVVDVTLQVSLGAESFVAVLVGAFVVFAVITLVMSVS